MNNIGDMLIVLIQAGATVKRDRTRKAKYAGSKLLNNYCVEYDGKRYDIHEKWMGVNDWHICEIDNFSGSGNFLSDHILLSQFINDLQVNSNITPIEYMGYGN